MANTKKEATQSIAVSSDEKLTFEVLAVAEGMKPATFARNMLYRGLEQYLDDRQAHGPRLDTEVYASLLELIEKDKSLKNVKRVVEMRNNLKPAKMLGRRFSAPNHAGESGHKKKA